MRYWVGAFGAFFLAILQASSVQQFNVLGVAPNLMLVFLVAWLLVRGFEDVLPMIAVSGITLGLIGLQTPGLQLLAMLLPLAALGLLREMHVLGAEPLLMLAFVGAASLAYETLMLAAVMATGGVFDPQGGFQSAVLPATLVNLMIAPPVYVAMRFARPPARRSVYSF